MKRLESKYVHVQPARRPLKIFASDPMLARAPGNRITIDVPNELIRPGPQGSRFEVIDYDGVNDCFYPPVDLNDPAILMQGGLEPTESDPRFHQQMVYAVAMRTLENFERALGRRLEFRDKSHRRLRLIPHAFHVANAFYDRDFIAILFGYFRADRKDPGPNLPGQMVFTCLAHDWGVVLPGRVSDKVAEAYDTHLFKGATLQDMPDTPRFVINAINVQSGALWRFMKPYMRDYRVGEVKNPTIPLANAVAASSAFPPILSPFEMRLDENDFTPNSGYDLQRKSFTTKVILTDGGVYDNLGPETAWKRYQTILVSDGGGHLQAEEEPKSDWARHSSRILNLIDNQVRSLRKRQVIGSYKSGARQGAYWGIRTNIANYELADALDCPLDRTMALAGTPTRLKRLDETLQERLINWGYAVCDTALRKYVEPNLPKPSTFPYPNKGV